MSDVEYWLKRAAQEDLCAARSASSMISKVHQAFAAAYRARIQDHLQPSPSIRTSVFAFGTAEVKFEPSSLDGAGSEIPRNLERRRRSSPEPRTLTIACSSFRSSARSGSS